MERARWSSYLRDPYGSIGQDSDPIAELDGLRRRFPFCRVLYLLQCRAMKAEDRLEWKEKAREWAILVPDRKKLFQLLNETTGSEREGEAHPAPPQEEGELDPTPSAGTEEASPIDPAPLEREILSEAVNKKVLYDAEEALIEEEEEDGQEGTKEPQERNAERAKVEEESPAPSNRSFTDWLDPSSGSGASSKSGEKEERSEQELIEAFIEEGEERPAPKKKGEGDAAFFSSERMAKKSSDESDLPVSETLAELYVQQGDIKRAIEAFEKLSLKFPEKSDYFADRVQELKERTKR